ncbi:hypothetical protein FRB90_009568, partial [Tulasnella sp. 427]
TSDATSPTTLASNGTPNTPSSRFASPPLQSSVPAPSMAIRAPSVALPQPSTPTALPTPPSTPSLTIQGSPVFFSPAHHRLRAAATSRIAELESTVAELEEHSREQIAALDSLFDDTIVPQLSELSEELITTKEQRVNLQTRYEVEKVAHAETGDKFVQARRRRWDLEDQVAKAEAALKKERQRRAELTKRAPPTTSNFDDTDELRDAFMKLDTDLACCPRFYDMIGLTIQHALDAAEVDWEDLDSESNDASLVSETSLDEEPVRRRA